MLHAPKPRSSLIPAETDPGIKVYFYVHPQSTDKKYINEKEPGIKIGKMYLGNK